MKKYSNPHIGLILISLFYIFGACILIFSMFTNYVDVAEQITQRHGLPLSLKLIVLPAIAILAIVMAYGLYSHSRWGYYLTLIYEIYFGIVSFILFLSTTDNKLLSFGNLIGSLIIVIYLIIIRRTFTHSKNERQALSA